MTSTSLVGAVQAAKEFTKKEGHNPGSRRFACMFLPPQSLSGAKVA